MPTCSKHRPRANHYSTTWRPYSRKKSDAGTRRPLNPPVLDDNGTQRPAIQAFLKQVRDRLQGPNSAQSQPTTKNENEETQGRLFSPQIHKPFLQTALTGQQQAFTANDIALQGSPPPTSRPNLGHESRSHRHRNRWHRHSRPMRQQTEKKSTHEVQPLLGTRRERCEMTSPRHKTDETITLLKKHKLLDKQAATSDVINSFSSPLIGLEKILLKPKSSSSLFARGEGSALHPMTTLELNSNASSPNNGLPGANTGRSYSHHAHPTSNSSATSSVSDNGH